MCTNSNRKPDDFTNFNKRLNELGNMLITLVVSLWKITDLNLCFPDVRKTNKQTNKQKTPSPQTNYDSKLVKLYFIKQIETFNIFSLSEPSRAWKPLVSSKFIR